MPFSPTVDEEYRDYETANDPRTNPHNPELPRLRLLHSHIKALAEGVAQTGHFLVPLVNADEGTANDIDLQCSVDVFAASFSGLFEIPFTAANTGPMTAVINDADAVPLKLLDGNDVEPGGVGPGCLALGKWTGTEIRMHIAGDISRFLRAPYGANVNLLMPAIEEDSGGRGPILTADLSGFEWGPNASDIAGAQTNATAATDAADRAEAAVLTAGLNFNTISDLAADTTITYIAGDDQVTTGQLLRIISGPLVFKVAAQTATDHHIETAGGVKLYNQQPVWKSSDIRQRKSSDIADAAVTGSDVPSQGFAWGRDANGDEFYFVCQRDTTGGADPELYRITQHAVGSSAIIAMSAALNINHAQDLSANLINNEIILYSRSSTGKGISIIEWDGASTTSADVTEYELFGASGSGHIFEHFDSATVAVSGDRVEVYANDTKVNTDDTGHNLCVYSLAQIIAATDSLDVSPIAGPMPVTTGPNAAQEYFQGVDIDGDVSVTIRGYVNPYDRKALITLDRSANSVSLIEPALSLNDYSMDDLMDHSTLGVISKIEPEGVSVDDFGRIHIISQEEWMQPATIVSYEGKNFTPRLNVPADVYPWRTDYWTQTTRPATEVYDPDTAYNSSGIYSKKQKVVHIIDHPLASATDQPINNPLQGVPSVARNRIGQGGIDFEAPHGSTILWGFYSWITRKSYRALGLYSKRTLRLFDASETADNSKYVSLVATFHDGLERLGLRVNGTVTQGAAIELAGINDTSRPGRLMMWAVDLAGNSLKFLEFDAVNRYFHALFGIPQLVISKAGNFTTQSTSYVDLITETLPANLVGSKGYIEIWLLTDQTNNSNSKYLKVLIGGQEVLATAGGVSSSKSTHRVVRVYANGSTSAQNAFSKSATDPVGETGNNLTTTTIDTTAPMTVIVRAKVADAADEITVKNFTVQTTYKD